jgi:hypothetical protein
MGDIAEITLLKQHFGKYRSPVFIGSWSVIVFEIRGK